MILPKSDQICPNLNNILLKNIFAREYGCIPNPCTALLNAIELTVLILQKANFSCR